MNEKKLLFFENKGLWKMFVAFVRLINLFCPDGRLDVNWGSIVELPPSE